MAKQNKGTQGTKIAVVGNVAKIMDEKISNKSQDLQECETFLCAIKALGGIKESIRMWERSRRHEWHAWEWDARRGEMVRRDSRAIPVIATGGI
jgi:hypothetical protein